MQTTVLVAAHNEADRLPATLAALAAAFPGARVVVADDGSTDDTAAVAVAGGAEVVSTGEDIGKGGAMTAAAQRALADGVPEIAIVCDGDLGESAAHLPALVEAVRDGRGDLAVGAFARRVGGGVGAAVGFARWSLRRLTGLELAAPISGQRAMRGDVLQAVVPFAPRFGMEIGMTVDATRAGYRVVEVPLDLEHRATTRNLRGFLHRGRQLADFVAVTIDRR
jgi:glycosyltransferase involved in cell wall biosynthesis